MIRIFNGSAYECKVIRFRFGSVIAEYQMLMDPDDPEIDKEYVDDVIQNAIDDENLDYITPEKGSLIVGGKFTKLDGIITSQKVQFIHNFCNWPIRGGGKHPTEHRTATEFLINITILSNDRLYFLYHMLRFNM